MFSDAPPVAVQEMTADDYQPMKFFSTQQEAKDYILKNGGLIVRDTLKDQWIVIRIPKPHK